jgi:hypothetical protein
MAATKANVNWTGVSHGSTNLTRVTQGSFTYGGNLIKFKGDVDNFPTIIVCPDQEPTASFHTADVGTAFGLTPGTTATLNATLNDAKLAAGGAVVFAMINSVVRNTDAQGSHAQYAGATINWDAYSSDGSTNPLSFSRT